MSAETETVDTASTAITIPPATQKIIDLAQQRRMDILAEAPEALKKKIVEIQSRYQKDARARVMGNYMLGVLIREVMAKETVYGSKAVEQIARYFDTQPTNLYAFRQVAATFSSAQVDEASQKELPNGGYITFQHLIVISRIGEPDDRNRMLARTLNEGLSTSQLEGEISSTGVVRRNIRTGGRKPGKPTSMGAAIQQVATVCQSVVNRYPVWDETFFQPCQHVDANKFDDAVVAKLGEALKNAEALNKTTGKMVKSLTANLARAKKCLTATKAAAKDKDKGKPAVKTTGKAAGKPAVKAPGKPKPARAVAAAV